MRVFKSSYKSPILAAGQEEGGAATIIQSQNITDAKGGMEETGGN